MRKSHPGVLSEAPVSSNSKFQVGKNGVTGYRSPGRTQR